MRKIYLLLFFQFALSGFSQTYTVTIGYNNAPTYANRQEFDENYNCNKGWGWCFRLTDLVAVFTNTVTGEIYNSENGLIGYTEYPQDFDPSSIIKHAVFKNIPFNKNLPNNPVFSDKTFKILGGGNGGLEIQDARDNTEFDEFTCEVPGWTFESYLGKIFVEDVQPNVDVFIPAYRKADANGIKTICSGEELGVFATQSGFPRQIYNWQYSIDNNKIWADVDEKYQVYNPNFTMEDILGPGYFNFYGQTIYLRLGSGCKAYSQEFALIYMTCAPVIKKIDYLLPPLCSGDNIRNITLTFDRDLYPQEELRYFQIKRVDVGIDPLTGHPENKSVPYPFIAQGDPKNSIVSKFDETTPNVFTYTLSNFTGLEDKGIYKIEYQAFKDNKEGAVVDSPATENFTYNEPAPLTFSLAETNPLCNNATGEVTINVSGGTLPYNYILDNENEVINGETVPKKNIFSGTSTIVTLTPVPHSIKVTDTNGCIDKTVKD